MPRVILRNVRLSFFSGWEKTPNFSGDMRYSTSIIVPKSDTANVTTLQNAIEQAKQEGAVSKWGGKVPFNLEVWAMRDGDTTKDVETYPEYANSWYLNPWTNNAPQIVKKDAATGVIATVINHDDVYSGCYADVSVVISPYKHDSGKPGINVLLGNVCKVADGERFGDSAGTSAESDFGAIQDSATADFAPAKEYLPF